MSSRAARSANIPEVVLVDFKEAGGATHIFRRAARTPP
jgi:hypothetical protein